MAARCPPGPEPMTTRSNGRIQGILNFFGGYRGFCGGGSFRTLSISDSRGEFLALIRSIGTAVREGHQMFLHRESLGALSAANVAVGSIRPQNASFQIIRQAERQNLIGYSLPQEFILQRKENFHAIVEIPRHPIRAAQVDL